MANRPFSRNCPLIEVTGDGRSCGRCWFYLEDEKTCPRHGDVSAAVERYKATGELTREQPKAGGTEGNDGTV